MAQAPDDEDPEIPPYLLAAGRIFGWTEVQTRWKIRALHRKWRGARRELAPASRSFENQICGECGAVQPYEAKTCSSCGQKLASSGARFLRTLGLSIPTFLSVSSLLGLAMILIYFRMMTEWKGQGLGGWEPEALIAHGALWPPAFFDGQWWRIGTANFLHIGVLHIFFNIAGLSQVGPTVEEVFGRARMVFFFAVTGVLAMLASAIIMPRTATAGASGALMGLIGVAAGWGHRRKTAQGREVRDQMIKWGVYTMLFGLVVGANNVAHGAGFIAGALIGLAFKPERIEKTKGSMASAVMGIVGSLVCGLCVMLTLVPPGSSRALAAQIGNPSERQYDDSAARKEYMRGVSGACRLLVEGKRDEAVERIRRALGEDVPAQALEVMCVYVRRAEDQCEAYLEGGLEPLLTPEEQLDPALRGRIERYFEVWCEGR